MNDFPKLLNDFFTTYLVSQKGISNNTINNYKYTFILLFEFLNQVKSISANRIEMIHLSFDTINEYLNWLEEIRKSSISTRNNRLAGLKSFFRYISYHEPKYLEQCNNILVIKAKKNISIPVNYLTIKATEYLISSLNRNDKKELRDLCIITLLYESGARVSELTDIKTYELKQSKPHTLILHGKGKKTRIIPIDKKVAELLLNYIKQYKINNHDYLFFNTKHEKLSREGITYILKKHFARCKKSNSSLFPNTISPHCLRHSKAMHLLENGVNLIYIRDFLGHSSVTTTEIYSKANPEIKRKHIEKATLNIIDKDDYNEEEKDTLLEWLKNNF